MLKTLDQNTINNQKTLSIKKSSKKFDWNDLFIVLQNFAISELIQIKDKSKNTAASQTNTENKIYQLRALLNLFFNQVNSSKIFFFNLFFIKFIFLDIKQKNLFNKHVYQ